MWCSTPSIARRAFAFSGWRTRLWSRAASLACSRPRSRQRRPTGCRDCAIASCVSGAGTFTSFGAEGQRMNAAPVPLVNGPSGARWIGIARWSTIVAVCSVMISPPLANAAMALMLFGLLASRQAGPRLKHACLQPLGLAALILITVIAAAMLWADVPWRDRWASFWSWRKLWMVPVALALFGPLLWKRRLIIAYVAVCGAAVLISFGIVVATGRLPTTV